MWTQAAFEQFLKEQDGASALSYGLLLGLVSVASLTVVERTGTSVRTLFNTASDNLGNVGQQDGETDPQTEEPEPPEEPDFPDPDVLVTTLTVTGPDDENTTGDLAAEAADGDGLSLPEIVDLINRGPGANGIADGQIVGFDSGASGIMTISNAMQLNSNRTVTIDGGNEVVLQQTGGNSSIYSNGTLTLRRITLTSTDQGNATVTQFGGSITLENVIADGGGGDSYEGVVHLSGQMATIRNSIFRNNTTPVGSSRDAGAIGIRNGTVTIDNTTFEDNSVTGADGGAIWVTGASTNVTITNSSFVSNTASSQGGAIAVEGGATVAISNTTFNENVANTGGTGGAIYMAEGTTVSISGGSFTDNGDSGTTYEGGALALNAHYSAYGNPITTLTLENATIDGNHVSQNGGGINLHGSHLTVMIENVDFDGNRADGGGGSALAHLGNGGTVTIANGSVTNNVSTNGQTSNRGAIAAYNSLVTVTNTTFSNNQDQDTQGNVTVN